MKNRLFLLLAIGLTTLVSCSQNIQQSRPAFNMASFDPRNFTFVATTAIPFSGQMRQLSSGYDVMLRNDTLISYLPYFGRSRSTAGIDEAGIRFTSRDFSVINEKRIDGTHEIRITLRDQRAAEKFYFTVYNNGTASLEVTGNFRDLISFKGDVRNNR